MKKKLLKGKRSMLTSNSVAVGWKENYQISLGIYSILYMYEALQPIGIFLCCRIVVQHEWLALIWIHLKTSFSYFIFSDCNLFQITATWVTWKMPALHCSINHSKDIL